MKKNFRVWLIVVASLIMAIVFFVAAGNVFSRSLENEEPIPSYVRIISCVLLCMAGLATVWISYTSIYSAGKGKNITPKDMLLEPFELLSQWTATDGKSYATLQDVKFRQWMTFLPGGEIKNIKPGDYAKPWFLGFWTLVPVKFYPKNKTLEQKKTENPRKSAKAQQTTVGPPAPLTGDGKKSDVKTEEGSTK